MIVEYREGELHLKKETLVFLDTDIIPEDLDRSKYNIVEITTKKKIVHG